MFPNFWLVKQWKIPPFRIFFSHLQQPPRDLFPLRPLKTHPLRSAPGAPQVRHLECGPLLGRRGHRDLRAGRALAARPPAPETPRAPGGRGADAWDRDL